MGLGCAGFECGFMCALYWPGIIDTFNFTIMPFCCHRIRIINRFPSFSSFCFGGGEIPILFGISFCQPFI